MSTRIDNPRPIRLAAVAASPVFYQTPLYRRLATDPRVDLTVLYGSTAGLAPYDDAEFGGRRVVWDDDLLAGYRSTFARAAGRNDLFGGFFALRDFDLFRRIIRVDYDVVWVHGFAYLTLWLAMIAAWLRRMPVLLREEQTLVRRRSWIRRSLRAPILRVFFRFVSGLFIGTNNRRHFEHYGMAARRLFYAPYCVDNEALGAEAGQLRPQKPRLRKEFGITEARPVILFVAKFVERKQPQLLLEAFREVRNRRPCALLFVGDGALEHDLRRRVAEAEIPDVHFAGFLNRSEIASAYVAADVFVLPSRDEPWGIVVNEAMNFALPIVASDAVGSAADLVSDGENGYLVPSGDVQALAAAIDRLVADPALRRRFGERSRTLVQAFNYDRASEGIVAACEGSLRQRTRLAA
jgi:glycosyltransferase involved in cell wall biosynthesis